MAATLTTLEVKKSTALPPSKTQKESLSPKPEKEAGPTITDQIATLYGGTKVDCSEAVSEYISKILLVSFMYFSVNS